MPWQRQVLETATELDERGRFVYDTVLVTVPRQSGKTTLVWPLMLWWAITRPRATVFYTAQTGKDARDRFRDASKLIESSPFASVTRARWSAGDTGLDVPLNGSVIRTFSPGMAAVHGSTPGLVVLDEIFAFTDELGTAMLDGAIRPAQQTLTGRAQVWLISTAGDATSTFMRRLVDEARAGTRQGLAYFEWSRPADLDPYEPATLEAFHPAVGHTVTAADLLKIRPSSHAAWLRAFCNNWIDAAEPLISLDDWDSLATDLTPPPLHSIGIGYEAADSPDSLSAVFAAWRDDARRPCLALMHAAPGTTWLQPLLRRIHAAKPKGIAADDGGTSRAITAALVRDELDVASIGARDAATCTAELLDAIANKQLRHDGSQSMRRSIAVAQLQRRGDVVRFSRSRSTGSISALLAATAALYAYDNAQTVLPAPLVNF
ncbi:terminase large subunit domain-containing protein [Gulosibacter bifidus]|uniref:Terminase large subunit domain-containing protein n=1 Tax=Gulosibacter bifidus TaxID=272239 RepID=A0ABW5RIX6_9MICO